MSLEGQSKPAGSVSVGSQILLFHKYAAKVSLYEFCYRWQFKAKGIGFSRLF